MPSMSTFVDNSLAYLERCTEFYTDGPLRRSFSTDEFSRKSNGWLKLVLRVFWHDLIWHLFKRFKIAESGSLKKIVICKKFTDGKDFLMSIIIICNLKQNLYKVDIREVKLEYTICHYIRNLNIKIMELFAINFHKLRQNISSEILLRVHLYSILFVTITISH